MELERMKQFVSGVWIVVVGILGLVISVGTVPGWLLLAAIAFGPPVIIALLWNRPAQTISESIRHARR